MANYKITDLTNYTNPDPANDVVEIVDFANNANKKITRNNLLGITSTPVGINDTQVLTAKTLTAPTITSAILSGTITGTYTLAGSPTFPSSVATLTGSQTLTNKILTSPTINAPTITNASITADAITGFTISNTGTIYGIAVTTGKLSGTSIANSTVGANQLNTGSNSASVATLQTTASVSFVDLATVGPAVTVTIGVNGLALVIITCYGFNSTGAHTYMGYVVSGANTIAASSAESIDIAGTQGIRASYATLLTGLATGSTTFTTKYSVSAGTGNFQDRRIAVVPL